MKISPELVAELKSLKSVEDIEKKLSENGIEVDEAEIRKACPHLGSEKELAEDELSNVAGGTCYAAPNPAGVEHAIVTIGNSACPCFVRKSGTADICDNCANFWLNISNVSGICTVRWKGHERIEYWSDGTPRFVDGDMNW